MLRLLHQHPLPYQSHCMQLLPEHHQLYMFRRLLLSYPYKWTCPVRVHSAPNTFVTKLVLPRHYPHRPMHPPHLRHLPPPHPPYRRHLHHHIHHIYVITPTPTFQNDMNDMRRESDLIAHSPNLQSTVPKFPFKLRSGNKTSNGLTPEEIYTSDLCPYRCTELHQIHDTRKTPNCFPQIHDTRKTPTVSLKSILSVLH